MSKAEGTALLRRKQGGSLTRSSIGIRLFLYVSVPTILCFLFRYTNVALCFQAEVMDQFQYRSLTTAQQPP